MTYLATFLACALIFIHRLELSGGIWVLDNVDRFTSCTS